MCRRHSGAAFLTYAATQAAAFAYERDPAGYALPQTPFAVIAPVCGSPLTFVSDSDRGTVWPNGGSLDDPDPVQPTEQMALCEQNYAGSVLMRLCRSARGSRQQLELR